MNKCPFCSLQTNEVVTDNDTAVALYDAFPVNKGHILVVPRRHVTSIFDLSSNEQLHLWSLVESVREHLKVGFRPDGFNIGVNDGEAAGQTVAHAHVHIIPRYEGDVADPRGGIRWINPEKAKYWK